MCAQNKNFAGESGDRFDVSDVASSDCLDLIDLISDLHFDSKQSNLIRVSSQVGDERHCSTGPYWGIRKDIYLVYSVG